MLHPTVASPNCQDVPQDGVPCHLHTVYARREDLTALDLVDQPVYVFDLVRRCMWWANPAAVQLWCAGSLPELLERDFASDMSEATKLRFDEYLVQLMDGQIIKERWTIYPNGTQSTVVDTILKGVPIEEGRLAMLVQAKVKHTSSDGSDPNDGLQEESTSKMSLREQQALRATEMLRHLPVAVCLTDIAGNILEQNPEALAVFGSTTGGSSTSDSENSTSPEEDEHEDGDDQKPTTCSFVKRFVDRPLGRRILEQAQTGKDVSLEALQYTVHGKRWAAIKVRQTKDPVTSNPILLYSARDITAVVEAKRQATTAELAKLDLVADMAHALRTPLQHVVGVVELLSKKEKPNKLMKSTERDNFTNLLQSAAQLLMAVIHDLMETVSNNQDLSSCSNHGNARPKRDVSTLVYNHNIPRTNSHTSNSKPRIILEHSPLIIKEVLQSAVATIQPYANAKDLVLRCTLHSGFLSRDTAALMGDSTRLGQVLFNLLHNACKFTCHGSISLSVRRLSLKSSKRVRLRFEVKDTGVGMNLEEQRKCMKSRSWKRDRKDDFDQEHHDATTRGVGLARCKTLVDAMGGTMGVQSKPGQGATFWVELPFLRSNNSNIGTNSTSNSNNHKMVTSSTDSRMDSSARKSGSSTLLDPVPDEGGLQILLVDKNHAGRSVMKALMEEHGHDVNTADDGDSMVTAILKGSFDLVLVETILPCAGTRDGTSRYNAVQAVSQLRTLGYSAESLPIIALTAAVPRADYPEMGFNDWLTKPMLMKDIQKAMTNAICNVALGQTHHDGGCSTSGGSLGTEDIETANTFSYTNTFQESSDRFTGTTGSSPTHDDRPVMPRRGSFGSLHSAFSDHLNAAMASTTEDATSYGMPQTWRPQESVATDAGEPTHSPRSAQGMRSSSQRMDRPPSRVARSDASQ
jgi:signal transduction histidine kinase/FixJ family two-component response regulator